MTAFRVGLTGGIASGKSTVARLFEELGIAVYDTDLISRQLMQPGKAGFEQAVSHFGSGILDAQHGINRSELRRIVFENPEERTWLEGVLHPLIREESQRLISAPQTGPYAILVVPLMFETKFDQLVQHIVVIDCPIEVQRHRLLLRDNCSPDLAEKMIGAQMSNAERLIRANSVIDNSTDKDLRPEVLRLHTVLKRLALMTN